MSETHPLRLRATLLATLAALAGIGAAATVADHPLPVRVATAGAAPTVGGALAGPAVAHAAFAAG